MIFRKRRCVFSLGFWLIGPSVLDGARSKVVLRGEGYAWGTYLVEFRQLQEVVFFSYLVYSLAKSHVYGYECSEACFSHKFCLKRFEPSG